MFSPRLLPLSANVALITLPHNGLRWPLLSASSPSYTDHSCQPPTEWLAYQAPTHPTPAHGMLRKTHFIFLPLKRSRGRNTWCFTSLSMLRAQNSINPPPVAPVPVATPATPQTFRPMSTTPTSQRTFWQFVDCFVRIEHHHIYVGISLHPLIAAKRSSYLSKILILLCLGVFLGSAVPQRRSTYLSVRCTKRRTSFVELKAHTDLF